MSIRNSQLAILFYRFSDKHVLPLLNRSFQSPDQLSAVGAVLAAGVPLGFLIHPLMGCLMILISALADVLDGQFARSTGQAGEFGAFWDSSLDRIADFFYLTGFWVLFRNDPRFMSASFLTGYAITSTFMISYVKARAESLGKSCHTGLMERGFRTVFMFFWAISLAMLPESTGLLLWSGLIIFCLLTTITVMQRIIEIRSQFPASNLPIATSPPDTAPKE